jgi:hypothetical protein
MITFEQIHDYLPQYLTPKKQRALADALADFENRDYYTQLYPDEMLQGDGWSSIEIMRFETGDRDRIKGILLSNSCDIDPKNRRDFPPRIVFAPLVRLEAYIKRLADAVDQKVLDNKLTAIRKQTVSSLFYLPAGAELTAEHIAILDDLHTIPLATFLSEASRAKLFTLGQMGFYLFLMKLSIHFCRFQEGIDRSGSSERNTAT